jgi:apolipoprotein N-acyltransferase|uniref:apolipoprotein N-acyltransferase n=1 Tax=uncultured Acidovorax sp. TaxID=158751 RepID=UPI0009E9781B|nr:apolipoprotein N-acyltransferase [uncultured Acidovorax sp.]
MTPDLASSSTVERSAPLCSPGRPQAAERAKRYALTVVAGAAQAWSIASPWDGQPSWWLQLLSLAALAFLLERSRSVATAFVLGWLFALIWLAGSVWWLFNSMHVHGGMHWSLAATGVFALTLFLSSYYALAAAAFQRLRPAHPALRAFLFAALWLAAELLRATLFTGFPWASSGYAHVDGPLSGLASWIGVYGIGTVAALVAYMPVLRSNGRLRRQVWSATALALIALAVGPLTGVSSNSAAPAGPVSVALLQANIPQDEKFEPATGVRFALQWYADRMKTATEDLVVAPETAIPLLPQELPAGYWNALRHRFGTGSQAALLGLPLGNAEEGYTNSVAGLSAGAGKYRYDKHHLVPFGEFVPPFFGWFTRMLQIPLGDFRRGAVVQPTFAWQGHRLAPNICYEDVFGEELAARFRDAAQAPTIFVNVSNIAWFGNTVAIDQHLQISRMRAKEFERPMLRATNTGATAIIDRFGRVTHALPRHTRGVLVGVVEGGTSITPYAWWVSRFGLWPFWILVACAAVLSARMRTGRR